ncbi:unnamed protein product [Linum trigynum]|uniref:DUF4283 domain-containing protein n=1 Tax=Linum trigynum TaxID=586398 RepID=A0AAV2CCU9_9ROSI
MATETTATTPTQHEGTQVGCGAWSDGSRKRFSEILQQDSWYVAESDSEDVAQAEREEDDVEDGKDFDRLCPSALFTAAEKARWRREWRSALVVKGLGHRVSYVPLSRRLNYLWARHGELQISDLKNAWFLVRFRRREDYEIAINGGPWLLGETYLTVMRWYKGFNPWKSMVRSTLVWVQLPDLPIGFIHKEAAMRIGGLIGTPVKVDRATELGARGNFARVCVEVDLTRPLLARYKVEGTEYLIQYEGLDHICTECGQYGKSTANCPCREPVEEKVEEMVEIVPETVEEMKPKGPIYDDWMMVKRKERRPNRRGQQYGPKSDKGKYIQEQRGEQNRFSVLNDEAPNEKPTGNVHNEEIREEPL